MSTDKLRELRLKYKAAYTAYMNSVHTLSIASLNGDWPTVDEILADEKRFDRLARARRSLLDQLRAHCDAKESGVISASD